MAGSGVRAMRYLQHAKASSVWANDVSAATHEALAANLSAALGEAGLQVMLKWRDHSVGAGAAGQHVLIACLLAAAVYVGSPAGRASGDAAAADGPAGLGLAAAWQPAGQRASCVHHPRRGSQVGDPFRLCRCHDPHDPPLAGLSLTARAALYTLVTKPLLQAALLVCPPPPAL